MPSAMETKRLKLRSWHHADLQSFAAMNADPKVCEFLPSTLTFEESRNFLQRIRAHHKKHGFGLWAIELKDGESFIGFTGLYIPSLEAHFTPCIEVGWRLAFSHWGKGYATEAAQAALAFGFMRLGLREIVAYTAAVNHRSRAVMERLSMTYNPSDDFDHPALPIGHRLRRHVLHRIEASMFSASREQG
jgi:RimJ/RimL family protein N-acetyltransferase